MRLVGNSKGVRSREGRGQRIGAAISSSRLRPRLDANARAGGPAPPVAVGAAVGALSGVLDLIAGIRGA
jgi:hypothetical protein